MAKTQEKTGPFWMIFKAMLWLLLCVVSGQYTTRNNSLWQYTHFNVVDRSTALLPLCC